MKINIGNYQITSDSMQFIVNKIGTVQESRFTNSENVGKETIKPVAYCGKFEEALRYIPNDALKSSDDINIIKEKLDQISNDIKALTEYPVIFIKEEPKSKIDLEEVEKEEVEE